MTPWTVQMRCTAKSKQSGEQCKRNASTGRTVCAMHGGKTPVGLASPHLKTGRWSKDLPTRMAALYEETAHDPELLSLRQDIRLIDALIQSKFDKLDTGESGEAWKLMRTSVESLEYGIDTEDYAGCRKALRAMRDVIDQRVAHYATEIEIRSSLDQRRKLVESETKITLAGEQAISVEKAMLLIGAIAGILKTRIHDTSTLATIQQDISLLLNAPEAQG
jgi:hypothetical protein